MVSSLGGAIFDSTYLTLPPNTKYSSTWLHMFQDEEFKNVFGGGLAVHDTANSPITILKSVTFRNCFGDDGAAVKTQQGGGLFCKDCSFELDEGFTSFTMETRDA